MKFSKASLLSALVLAAVVSGASLSTVIAGSSVWDPKASAKYLDDREIYWQKWEHATRDPDTRCVSCHTQIPYALSRPMLRKPLQEQGPTATEDKMLADVRKRVNLWDSIEPFYVDTAPIREAQSRGTESILNALILSSYDSETGQLSPAAHKAFNTMWESQLREGKQAGSWTWLDFHNAPWEGTDSEYQGATFAALAVGLAPEHYKTSPAIQPQLSLLREYLRRNFDREPLANQLVVLWTSSKLPGLLTPEKKKALTSKVLALQLEDGGWTLSSLGSFKRYDNTQLETRSDGYATGLTVLALEDNRLALKDPRIDRALAWLRRNQSQTEGSWAAYSLNKQRDPASNVGHFMTDAATGFASMALLRNR